MFCTYQPRHRAAQTTGRGTDGPKRVGLILLISCLVVAPGFFVRAQGGAGVSTSTPSTATVYSDRERDGLFGPVRRVRVETAKFLMKSGKLTEAQRTLLATATYDLRGNKIDGANYVIADGTATGKEDYKYDGKGNITEMTRRDKGGYIISREIYAYEYDNIENWTKMITSAAVIEDGKPSFEPIEVTYRSITYYLDEVTSRSLLPAQTRAADRADTISAAAPASDSAAIGVRSEAGARQELSAKSAVTLEGNSTGTAADQIRTPPAPPTGAGLFAKSISPGNSNGVAPTGADEEVRSRFAIKVDNGKSEDQPQTTATRNRISLSNVVRNLDGGEPGRSPAASNCYDYCRAALPASHSPST